MKRLLFCFSFFLTASCFAQSLNIIPAPQKAEMRQGIFTISSATKIVLVSTDVQKSAAFINDYLTKFYDIRLQFIVESKFTKENKDWQNAIVLNLDDSATSVIPGNYKLSVETDKVLITADNQEGVFYGTQSLIQLLPIKKEKKNTYEGSIGPN